jgi:hypothetical protein
MGFDKRAPDSARRQYEAHAAGPVMRRNLKGSMVNEM